jgi:DNA modification methylase
MLAKQLKRRFVSAEIDGLYYKMICERLKLNGIIPQEYKLNGITKTRNSYQEFLISDKKSRKNIS